MHLLILGGTSFLGRHLVTTAQDRGHTVTIFHRGRTNPGLFPAVETILGDRTADLAPLTGRRWDAVVDTSGYHPRDVAAAVAVLAGAVDRYLFVSTISVYADYTIPQLDEHAPVARLDDPDQATVSNETYGPLKTHCEDVVLAQMGARAWVVRPGLIVGPHDPTDRFTYWPVRARRGGEILAPDTPATPVQFIDARDLAAWMVHGLEQGLDGIYNATGPAAPYTFGELLQTCLTVVGPGSGAPAQPIWVSADFIAQQEIVPFIELPLWVPPDMPGLLTVDCRRAIQTGLHFRPVVETVADTLTWFLDQRTDQPLRAGLDPARERELLAAWHRQTGSPPHAHG